MTTVQKKLVSAIIQKYLLVLLVLLSLVSCFLWAMGSQGL